MENKVSDIVSSEKPSPQTTLAILLGASDWPNYKELTGSPAFTKSANKVRNYFCNPGLFGLPSENWLDLFDQHQDNPNEVDLKISKFLSSRISQMKQSGTPAKDLLFYYIGHGILALDAEQAYHLAIRSTRRENISASAVVMASLAHTLKTQARHLRRIVILDCCFAAKAFPYLTQSDAEQAALLQTLSAFEDKRKGVGSPKKGTALLCSSGARDISLILSDESGTMFSEALTCALALGDAHQPGKTHLSLQELKLLTEDILETLPEGSAPRPFLACPDQSEGDMTFIPFFPNPRTREEKNRQGKTFLNEEQRPVSIKRGQPNWQQILEAAHSPDSTKRAEAYSATTDFFLSQIEENPRFLQEYRRYEYARLRKQVQVQQQSSTKTSPVSTQNIGGGCSVAAMIVGSAFLVIGVFTLSTGGLFLVLPGLMIFFLSRLGNRFLHAIKVRWIEDTIVCISGGPVLLAGIAIIIFQIMDAITIGKITFDYMFNYIFNAIIGIILSILSITLFVRHFKIKIRHKR